MPNIKTNIMNDDPAHLSFSLTRIQRIFNPLSSALSYLMAIVFAGIPFMIIGGLPIALVHRNLLVPWTWLMVSGGMAVVVVSAMMKVPIIGPLRALINNDRYINRVEIDKEFIYYGLNDLSLRKYYNIPLKTCSVRRGLFAVSIVSKKRRLLGTSLVIPYDTIPFEELRQRIEGA